MKASFQNLVRYLFFLIVYTNHFNGWTQNFQVIDTSDYEQRTSTIKNQQKNFEELQASFKKEFKKKMRLEVSAAYKDLQEDFEKNVEKKRLIFDTDFNTYIDSLKQVLITGNPSLNANNLHIYLSRHNAPNALNMGNGIIILNIGLFKYLENEDQLASVISHEIAHQSLEHVKQNIVYKAALNTSKEKQQLAKTIKKEKYNQYDKAFGIMKELIYANSKLHKKQELEADSLGFEYFNKTSFTKIDFIKALERLEELDTLPSIELKKDTYASFFNLPKLPFKEEWLKMEDFSTYNYEHYKKKIEEDSVKSHPEILERIASLKNRYPKEFSNTKSKKPENRFLALQKIARQEDVANWHYIEKYGASIYLCLYKLEKNPTNTYYKKWLGKNFAALYQAKKKYIFNRYVDRVIPNKQSENYQQLISFLWNLNLNELQEIADYYQNVN